MKGKGRIEKRPSSFFAVPFILILTSFLTMFGVGSIDGAEVKYPTKPVKLVVPYGTGGSTDIAARALAAPIQEFLGQPVAVVNIPGAGGAVGFDDPQELVLDVKWSHRMFDPPVPAMNPNPFQVR
jgi:hypothetical protein